MLPLGPHTFPITFPWQLWAFMNGNFNMIIKRKNFMEIFEIYGM